MNSLEPKKLALLRILEILKKHSDIKHPLTQEDIIHRLKNDYGITLERKAISRNISLLREAGYEIVSSLKGSYLDSRDFEDSELRMLIDGVLSSKYIPPSHSGDLINRLCNLSSVYFKSQIKNAYSVNEWSKTENQAVFYNIDIINEAILLDKKISFDYNKYSKDKSLHKSDSYTVSPYQLVLHRYGYFLIALSEKSEEISYFRLDRITDIKITKKQSVRINTVKGYERGIDYNEIATARPYMYSDAPERIELIASEASIDNIIDSFGKDIRISDTGEGKCKIMLKSSVMAMEQYAMQYIDQIEIVKPDFLRLRIREKLQSGFNKYS